MKPPVTPQPWALLRRHTAPRIGLGRAGASLPTAAHLAFPQAHAAARDAVHLPCQVEPLLAGLRALGEAPLQVQSRAADRTTYLQRPDLGRRLSEASAAQLAALDAPAVDLAFVLADGLSSLALQRQALPLFAALRERLVAEGGWTWAPPVLALQARVALGDEVGALLWVDIGASLKLFGGLDALLADFDAGFADSGHSGQRGVAPTLEAAAVLARLGLSRPIGDLTELPAVLDPLPLSALPLEPKVQDALKAVGLSTVGELLALPAAPLAKRHVPAFTLYLDRLLGRRPDVRPRYRLPPKYQRRFDLLGEVAGMLF